MVTGTPARSLNRAANAAFMRRSATTRDAVLLEHRRLRAEHRGVLGRARHQKSLALLRGSREHALPIDLARGPREPLRSLRYAAGVERRAAAIARQVRLQRFAHAAAQQSLQRRSLAENSRRREHVLAALA